MSLAEEVGGLAELITAKYPEAVVHRFQEPPLPAAGEFAVTLKQETRRSETRSQTRVERQYMMVCYANDAKTAILTMEALSRSLMNEGVDAGGVLSGPVRAESFTIDAPEKLDSGLQKCNGTIHVHARESVTFKNHEKIGKVEMRLATINLKGGMK
ncbi:hypothetical protein DFP94_11277 [Fontibacillus phaseoli]|uniref:Uncharacterized protein n=1 Tax=Fontibacillus phaseoli TaxID=1416533 RepID=A0A369B7E8_9BACL|nr:hypothetical protein [Fontibacillus phaseoli]RCX16457.1 hypothetical protein DFP94_11277 [Fontibacillus phaseoli]